MSSGKTGAFRATFKRLWPYVRQYKSGFFAAIIGMAVYGVVDASLVYMIKPLIDNGLAASDPATLRFAPLVILGLFLFRGIANFVSTYCLAWVSQNVIHNMRQEIFGKYLRLPVSFFDSNSTGDLISKVTYDAEQVSRASSSGLIIIVRASFTLIGLLAIMFWESWQLSAIFFLIGPIIALVISTVSKRFRAVSKRIQGAMGGVTTVSEQMLKGHKNVLAFGGQEVELKRFTKASNRTRQQNMKLSAASALSQPLIQIIAAIGLSVVLFVASFPSILNSLTPGSFVVIIGSMMALMTPIKQLTKVNVQLQRGVAAAESIFAVLDEPEVDDTGTKTLGRSDGKIEVNDLTFQYPSSEGPVLKQVNLSVPAGKTLALVGRSGSGKSTLSNLLPRFYEINQGSIAIDDVDIRELTMASLRQQMAIVSQQVVLFNDTIANNIAYACDEAVTRAQIEAAAEAAHVLVFTNDMPEGLDTMVGEDGLMLSGGQRQRIAIARAILRDTPILILDEATSALDTESERVIQSALDRLAASRTSIVIAHRLSTIEKADEIVVMDKGEIVERGTHQQLLAKQGAYAQLHAMQFGE
ncbi:lipid A export permease/ATP-binding protein MsbA [Ferrimonas lipolytica]|uniref:Lipid A export permease/ATP-binding protein MsbA n=1 Tax=Ferrimonas lipolytica TaxID=2724191 RepID=A0A6H1UAX6_9GAMM|nr:lipid A export permease/ATP-binding protein MsbA [Ferrimonas lipolytica]QIZ75988.1 lipid A export permease/ATP-binding protein MsbA [Ferrimonas lipolytica]